MIEMNEEIMCNYILFFITLAVETKVYLHDNMHMFDHFFFGMTLLYEYNLDEGFL